jgi:hypothetical protein
MNTPDNWIIVKITAIEPEPFYKILCGWSGGYLDGDSWRMNSGITEVKEDGDYIDFIGHSGSVYRCHKEGEAIKMSFAHIFNKMLEVHGDKVSKIDYVDFVKEFEGQPFNSF